MKELIVGFSKPKSFSLSAWFIMAGYNIPYDHVYVKIDLEDYDRTIVYQASSTMVNFMSLELFNDSVTIVDEFTVQISDENYQKLIQFALDNAGKPYGFVECVGLLIVRIFELFGKKIQNPLGSGQSTYVCSKLAGFILEQYAGASIPDDIDNITPKDVFNYLTSLKN